MRQTVPVDPAAFAAAVEAAKLSYAEIGRQLGVDAKTVRRWRDKGEVPLIAVPYLAGALPGLSFGEARVIEPEFQARLRRIDEFLPVLLQTLEELLAEVRRLRPSDARGERSPANS